MNREEIEKRIIICDERARGYLEVGKCGLADKYYTEKNKWEKLLDDLDLLNDRKIYELLEYKRSYFTLVKKCEKKQEVIDKAIEYINNLTYWYEHSSDNICSLEDKFKSELLQILEDKEAQ